MNALPITPEEVQTEPIVGWRIWRVLEVDTLDGTKAVRLGAAGTKGLPPQWPPLQPIAAVCSKFNSNHEAPWPDHECGIYALRTRRLVDELLQTFVQGTNGDQAQAWAIGRVSLWGRVIECERGWRGQYAYPYALTVLSDDESLARRLGAVYAVDVDSAPPIVVETPVDDDAAPAAIGRIEALEMVEKLEAQLASLRDEALAGWPEAEDDEKWWHWWRWRVAEEERDARLWPAVRDVSKEAPATTEQIVLELARADGFTDESRICGTSDVQIDLTRLAYRGEVLKLRPTNAPAGKLHWSWWPSRIDGFSQVADVHLEQDLAVVRALAQAGNEGDGPVLVRTVHEALGESINKAQVVQSLIRCVVRGWAVGSRADSRSHYSVTAHGREITEATLLTNERRPKQDEVLAVLRAAADEGQRFLDCHQILRRLVPITHRYWMGWRGGEKVGPMLTRLAEQGIVVRGERRGNLWTWGLV